MKIIKPSVEWTYEKPDGMKFLQAIELAGRTCYKSGGKIEPYYKCHLCDFPVTNDHWDHLENDTCPHCKMTYLTPPSCFKFVRNLINRGHLAMIEHAPDISMRFICDRGVSHEIVRHRLFSFAMESTRYCNYGDWEDKENHVTFILPNWLSEEYQQKFIGTHYMQDICHRVKDFIEPEENWYWLCRNSEVAYQQMIRSGWTPQQARSVLPNSLKTEIVVKGNAREWMHFFELRCDSSAHPQMREVALMALRMCHEAIPVVFDNLWQQHIGETK